MCYHYIIKIDGEEVILMAKLKCECAPCNHEFEESKAVVKDGKHYCSEVCATGACTDEHGHKCDCDCAE